MSLRIKLKPHERVMIGRTILVNGSAPADFSIEGERRPILRGQEIMDAGDVDTPCKRLYLMIQNIYLDNKSGPYAEHDVIVLAKEIESAAESLKPYLADALSLFVLGEHYKALGRGRLLIEEEATLIAAATGKKKAGPSMMH